MYRDSAGNTYVYLPSNTTALGAQPACRSLGPNWNAMAVTDNITETAVLSASHCGGNPNASFPFWTGGYDANRTGGFANGAKNYTGWAWTSNAPSAYFISRQGELWAT